MDKEIFFNKLKIAISSVYNEIPEKEDLFEFGIFTDQDVSTFLIGYNTYSNYANILRENLLKSGEVVSYFRWLMPEWSEEILDTSIYLNEINGLLYEIIQPNEAKLDPDFFKSTLLNLMTKVLIELKEEGLFNEMKDSFILFIQQADSGVQAEEKARLKTILNEKQYHNFLIDLNYIEYFE